MGYPAALDVIVDIQGEQWLTDAPPAAAGQLVALCAATLARIGVVGRYEISLVMTDDATIRQVNRRTRGQDKPTDVLSFPLSTRPLIALPVDEAWEEQPTADDLFVTGDQSVRHLGDIIVSPPTVRRQAAAAGHSWWWECCYIVVHGMLHLAGYDDATEAGYGAMIAHQHAILDAYGIASERG